MLDHFLAFIYHFPLFLIMQLYKKVIRCPEVFAYRNSNIPLSVFVESLYNTEYIKLFPALLQMIVTFRCDWLLFPHSEFISKKLRERSYRQYLEPYRTMKIETMSSDFGISEGLIKKDLSRFIAVFCYHHLPHSSVYLQDFLVPFVYLTFVCDYVETI